MSDDYTAAQVARDRQGLDGPPSPEEIARIARAADEAETRAIMALTHSEQALTAKDYEEMFA